MKRGYKRCSNYCTATSGELGNIFNLYMVNIHDRKSKDNNGLANVSAYRNWYGQFIRCCSTSGRLAASVFEYVLDQDEFYKRIYCDNVDDSIESFLRIMNSSQH